ncbi:MAG: hypothetical protein AAF281_15225 [Pseudomonadota bacterium]
MADGTDPMSRLTELGFALPPYEAPEDPLLMPYNLIGNRLCIGALAPFMLPDMTIPRLGQDANIDPSAVNLDDLDEAHPMRKAFVGARLAVLRSLSVAAFAAGEDLNKIQCCVRASLTVRTGPNFERLGVLGMPLSRIMFTLFGTPPAINVVGVSALPGAVPMVIETEYLLADG